MTKRFFAMCFGILTGLSLLSGCYEEIPETTFTPGNPGIVDTLWLRNADGSAALDRTIALDTLLRQPGSSFTINPQVADTVRGNNWNLVYPANAFALPGGGGVGSVPITAPIELTVQPLFSKGQMLRHAMSTTLQGQRVQAFGLFTIRAVLNNVELVLRPGMELRLSSQLTGLPPIISLFQLNASGSGPLTNIWQPPADSSRLAFTLTGSPIYFTRRLGTVAGFLPASGSGQWQANVSVVLPANFTNANTVVYAMPLQQNSLVRLLPNAANKTFVLPNASTSETMRFVAISLQGGQFFMADHSQSLQGNPVVRLTPSVVAKQQIEAVVDAL